MNGATRRARSGLLTGLLMLPAGMWYLFLLIVPLLIVVVFSFGVRGPDGGYQPAFTLDNYQTLLRRPQPFIDSLFIAISGTGLCILIGFPLAYFIATRATKRKTLLLVLLIVPFWTSFLVRTIAWLIILGPDGLEGFFSNVTGGDVQILGTQPAVLLGIVYNYLPLMALPIYISLERLDRSFIEASRDLGAGQVATFRQITLPLSAPGVISGCLLVFIPVMGEYLIPVLLGGGKTYFLGNALADLFLQSRNWPFGAALATAFVLFMLGVVGIYTWLTRRLSGAGREASLL
jgi:spermidine/putrescine transport system permease protein